MRDLISRQAAIDALSHMMDIDGFRDGWAVSRANVDCMLKELPSAQPEEVIPHRNYKYLSDYWCVCGWHLGKKGDVKYCANCGRKVNWNG